MAAITTIFDAGRHRIEGVHSRGLGGDTPAGLIA
jgi:hypothetical protein